MAKWNQVVQAKPVRILIDTPDGRKMYTTGVKVTFGDGTWWFYSFRHGTYTRHTPGAPKTDHFGRPTGEHHPEVVDKFSSQRALERELGHCPVIVSALRDAVTAVA